MWKHIQKPFWIRNILSRTRHIQKVIVSEMLSKVKASTGVSLSQGKYEEGSWKGLIIESWNDEKDRCTQRFSLKRQYKMMVYNEIFSGEESILRGIYPHEYLIHRNIK